MSNKKQFEEILLDLPKEGAMKFFNICGPLQFYPAISDINEDNRNNYFIKLEEKEIENDYYAFDCSQEDPEKCRQIIMDVWKQVSILPKA